MKYLSSHTIYHEVVEGMEAMDITPKEFAKILHVSVKELEEFLTPTHDYTISEIGKLLSALYLDIKVDIVPD